MMLVVKEESHLKITLGGEHAVMKRITQKTCNSGVFFDVITEVVGHLDQFILHCWLIV